jgi:cytochrome c biogenesis protein CcmG/thiol:disulfide interchange protein DsbE
MADRVSPLVFVPPLLFAALATAFFVGMQRSNPEELPSTLIGRMAPPVTGEALSGFAGINGSDLTEGELTLVNFWASWCPPCRAEHPTLLDLAEQGIRIVGVNFNDQEGAALRYLADDGNPFAAVPFDPKGRTSFDWGVAAPPETFIVDAEGKVVFKFIGPLVGSDYQQRFLPELEKAQNGS